MMNQKDANNKQQNSLNQVEETIMQVLTSNPTPEQVMALHPSPEFQAQVSELLARSKQGQLSSQEELKLERYLTLEHLVRLAKAYAAKRMGESA